MLYDLLQTQKTITSVVPKSQVDIITAEIIIIIFNWLILITEAKFFKARLMLMAYSVNGCLKLGFWNKIINLPQRFLGWFISYIEVKLSISSLIQCIITDLI